MLNIAQRKIKWIIDNKKAKVIEETDDLVVLETDDGFAHVDEWGRVIWKIGK